MQSTFEHNAQRAAVKAVEDRLAHNDRVRREATKRRTLSTFGGWLVGLAVLVAIGYWFTGHSESAGSFVGSAVDTVRGLFSDGASVEPSPRDDGVRREKLSVTVSPSQRPKTKRDDSKRNALKGSPANVKPIR